MKYIITLDEGTTSARTLITNDKTEVVGIAQKEFEQIFPAAGHVEHDAMEIWDKQLSTIKEAIKKAGISADDIAGIGITNQRETIVVWDKNTGKPIHNALVWQDQRTADYCNKLIEENKNGIFNKKTGLLINPYFSGTKLKWILDNVEGAREKADKGEILAGTIDTWLIWKLTDGEVHATDVSNASRTLLYNIHENKWDGELLDILDIPINVLPKVHPSSAFYGKANGDYFGASNGIEIAGVIGDQQSALFGQMAIEVGDVKNTYGTGCFTLMNTGTKAVPSKNNLLTTIAWQIGDNDVVYALEGSVFIAGAAIQWLRDGLKIIKTSSESNDYIANVKKEEDIYFVPSFTGLGAPYWDTSSRGAIFGLERSTSREHIVKAAVEAIAYQSNDLVNAFVADSGKPLTKLLVDGGATSNDYLMQFQASISNVEVVRPKNQETTAMGAAYMAGLAVGVWKDVDEIKHLIEIDKTFTPEFSDEQIKMKMKGWKAAVKRTMNWLKDSK